MASSLPDWINVLKVITRSENCDVGAPGQSDASIVAMIKALEAARTFTHENGIQKYDFNLSTDVEECLLDTHYAVMTHYASVIIDW